MSQQEHPKSPSGQDGENQSLIPSDPEIDGYERALRRKRRLGIGLSMMILGGVGSVYPIWYFFHAIGQSRSTISLNAILFLALTLGLFGSGLWTLLRGETGKEGRLLGRWGSGTIGR